MWQQQRQHPHSLCALVAKQGEHAKYRLESAPEGVGSVCRLPVVWLIEWRLSPLYTSYGGCLHYIQATAAVSTIYNMCKRRYAIIESERERDGCMAVCRLSLSRTHLSLCNRYN